MPEEVTSVTGSIFSDSDARYRFGYKQNFQVGDIITVVLTELLGPNAKVGLRLPVRALTALCRPCGLFLQDNRFEGPQGRSF